MFCCRKTSAVHTRSADSDSVAVSAQTADNPPAPSGQAQPASQPPRAELLKPEQLEALVAPIALYPDALLANMLAAATYPLEVVEADRFVKENKNLKSDALKVAVDKKSWDDSVKALTATPSVLDMMSDKLDWSKSLGDAMLAQQADLMDAIQRLREKARANNKLSSNKQQKVTVKQQESKQVIVIEPTDPDTMYVPYYEPATVYGEWPYADYPPYYFGYPSYIGAGVVAAGIAFGYARAIGRWGNYWGGGCNWGNRNVYVNRRTTNVWQHNAAHRQGVRYNNANVQQRFGNNNIRAGADNRMDFRGKGGQQVLKPGATDRTRATVVIARVRPSLIVQETAAAIVREIVVEIAPATAAIAPPPIVPARPIARAMPAIVATPATAPSRAVEAIAPRRTGREAEEEASMCRRAAQPVLHPRAAARALPAPAVLVSTPGAADSVVAEEVVVSAAVEAAAVAAEAAGAPTSR